MTCSVVCLVGFGRFFLLQPSSAPSFCLGQEPLVDVWPFDRLLVTQAAQERLSLLTTDRTLLAYSEVVRWVG